MIASIPSRLNPTCPKQNERPVASLTELDCLRKDSAALDENVPALRIRDRSGTLIHFHPNEAQQRFAARRAQRNIILKARQLGITTYIAARFFLDTILHPGTVTLQVAHSLESAQQIFRIVHRFLRHLPGNTFPAAANARVTLREISFPAIDSRYIVDTAGNRNAGRGLTVHNLHASEVALWPGDPRETMAALLASVPPGGTVEVESTPRGMGGYFHTEWVRSAASAATFTPHFFPWWIEPAYRMPLAPGESLEPFSEDEQRLMDREKLTLEQIRYRRWLRAAFGDLAPQEFAENAADCFLVSGRPVFDIPSIDARLRTLSAPLRIAQNGAEQTWFDPQPGRNYLIGADVAEGSEEGDFSAAVVVDVETGLQCTELMARWPLHRFAQELAELGRRYNDALIAVERNSQGHAVLYALTHQFGYARLYRHREFDGGSKPGWPMNAQTKPQVIGVITRMLQQAPQVFASARLLEQCRSFSYVDSGEMGARPGMHDDLVIAMAIALAVRAQAGNPQLFAATP
jgi:hypothetical protein